MMPNPLFNTSDSKSSMVESKPNNSAATTTTNSNADLKHNNSLINKNNNADTKNNPDANHSNTNNSDVKTSSDSKTNADSPSQGDGGALSPHGAVQPSESQHSLDGNKVYKSGPLFLSSKGIGWTSWKKRWFVLTQTSLVFFRSDPNASSQKGGEANLTLGGIDLNSSGSVVAKADKKLLTVVFPDGRDGRTITLKAETTEDLNEWKAALEEALENAPTATASASPKEKEGTLKDDKTHTPDASSQHSKDRSLTNSVVLGRPILLALEDVDGTPSFLEKALRYVEDHGVKVEGILRQAADVEDVERRIREYEQGKVEFTEQEDAHVIGDCIKYVLRELPSSPVPASCCNALLDAYRTDRSTRVSAMRAAICDTFPEPNRRLLQRILIMMETVADNKTENRMSVSAVAACMAPLLLRPLLAGECNLDGQFNMGGGGGGDGSAQLLQAAAAANHAQAIVITLLEEYDNIFGEGDMLSDLYSDSEEAGSESEELSEEEIYEDDDDEYSSEGSNADGDSGHASTSQSGDDAHNSQTHNKGPGPVARSISHKVTNDVEGMKKLPSSKDHSAKKEVEHSENEKPHVNTSRNKSVKIQRSSTTKDKPANMQRMTSRRTGANKKPSNVNEEAEVERLEATKGELKEKVEAEVKENSALKEDLMNKKKSLEAQRLQLEHDVARLEEQLRKELEVRKKLETGIKISQQALFAHASTNETAESDAINLHQKLNDLEGQPPNPGKVKDSSEATATSHGSKDTHSSKDGNEKHQLHTYTTKLPPHKKLDPTRSCKNAHFTKDTDEKQNFHSFSSRLPPSQHSDSTKDMKKSSSTKPKRLNSRNENTGSAMSKITNGLNFLKERSNQLADEFQIMNKDRNKSQSHRHARKGSQDELDIQSSVRPKESQLQHLDAPTDRGRRSDDQSTNPSTDKQHDESSQQTNFR